MTEFLEEAEAVAVKAAKEAAKVLMKHFRKDVRIGTKGGNHRDILTNADTESQALITKMLLEEFPEHRVIGEEGDKEGPDYKPGAGSYTWHIDPLDGTINYSRGSEYFSVCIALAQGDELLIGVVHAPATGELYTATEGKGAFASGKKLGASKTTDMKEAFIYTDLSTEETKRHSSIEAIKHLAVARAVRSKGSGALEMCEAASGIADGYFHIGSKAWDYAASSLIIREAGGVALDLEGNEWKPSTADGIAAGNSAIAREMLVKVREAIKKPK